MKAILLIAALFACAVPVKAEDSPTESEMKFVYYGFIYGTTSTLCAAVEDEAIKKEYAQYFITKLIKEWREDKTNIPKDFIQSGFEKAKNDHEICIGVYE